VLNRQELQSRVTAYLEKYAKQILIESETMVMMGRQMIMPAAIAQETRLAEAVAALKSAGTDSKERQSMLERFSELVHRFTTTLEGLAEADNLESHDALEHARYMKHKIIPLMDLLRAAGDELENHVSMDLWPLPSYREMLFLK
jgi:glutamine synthetase